MARQAADMMAALVGGKSPAGDDVTGGVATAGSNDRGKSAAVAAAGLATAAGIAVCSGARA
eukprot:12455793-Alexandrium_andersonii.AAC.1